jgi:hypothetical protein
MSTSTIDNVDFSDVDFSDVDFSDVDYNDVGGLYRFCIDLIKEEHVSICKDEPPQAYQYLSEDSVYDLSMSDGDKLTRKLSDDFWVGDDLSYPVSVELTKPFVEYAINAAKWKERNLGRRENVSATSLEAGVLGMCAEMCAVLMFCPQRFSDWATSCSVVRLHRNSGRNSGCDIHSYWTGLKFGVEVKSMMRVDSRWLICARQPANFAGAFTNSHIPMAYYVLFKPDPRLGSFKFVGWCDGIYAQRNATRNPTGREGLPHYGVLEKDLSDPVGFFDLIRIGHDSLKNCVI